MRRWMMVVLLAILLVPLIAYARAQRSAAAGPNFASKLLLDNDRVRIQRLTVPVGFRDPVSVVPNDQIAIQVTPGELEVIIDGQKTVGRVEPGTAFYVPKNAPHQFNNVGGTSYDTVVVMLK